MIQTQQTERWPVFNVCASCDRASCWEGVRPCGDRNPRATMEIKPSWVQRFIAESPDPDIEEAALRRQGWRP